MMKRTMSILQVKGMPSPPSPPAKGSFASMFSKGSDVIVMVNDSGLTNELGAQSLLHGIILSEDMEQYNNIPMNKLLAWQKSFYTG